MSGVHKNPTISFRISDYERREIEARIKASGMMKKTFFTRCCINGRTLQSVRFCNLEACKVAKYIDLAMLRS